MGAFTLELRSPKNVEGIALDPQPDWSFDSLLMELNSIEEKLNVNSSPFVKIESRELSALPSSDRTSKGFIMHISDDDIDDIDADSEKEVHNPLAVTGRRFACDDLYLSDDSDDESAYGIQCHLVDPVGLVEGALFETTHEHQLSVMEEVRNRISALEADLINENEKFVSTLERVEKYREAKRDMDRKLDMQYQRRIAEALDNHLTAVQRDHEHRSQIEEKKIRDDAAREEARRREKALQEEKARQEKLKAEAEKLARLEAERVKAEKAAAEEAERRAAEQAAEKKESQTSTKSAPEATEISGKTTGQSPRRQSDVSKNVQPAGNIIRGAESALKLEERRLSIYKEVAAKNEALGLGSNKDYRRHGMQIARMIRTIAGSRESVRVKADELTKLINDSTCPQSISIAMFAEKFVSVCSNPTGSFNSTAYAYGRVIVSVTSKFPLAMNILIAELNRACIFTVPKYLSYSESAFESKEAYQKAIGYHVEDGNIESTDSYLKRLSAYMKLYGALVQTEVEGIQNLHGLTEGWAWLARFLNTLPSNLYTATALQAFIEMAGFALFKRYKSQFIKLINIIEHGFLKALQGREDPSLSKVIANIKNYIESRQFLKEPEGRQMKTHLESKKFDGDSGNEEQYYYQSNRFYNNPSWY